MKKITNHHNFKMKISIKIERVLYFMLFIGLVSCSGDDSSEVDSSLLMDGYEEPYLNFLVDEDTFVADDNGQEDERSPISIGFSLSYNRDLNGIVEYFYAFSTSSSYPEGRFVQVNVYAEPNQHNLDLLRNTLTDIYGEPDFFSDTGSTLDTFVFPYQLDTYTISLNYTRNNFNSETPILFVAYINNQ